MSPEWQWNVGELITVNRPSGPMLGIVRLMDLRTLRLKVLFIDGDEEWVYVEKCFKQ